MCTVWGFLCHYDNDIDLFFFSDYLLFKSNTICYMYTLIYSRSL